VELYLHSPYALMAWRLRYRATLRLALHSIPKSNTSFQELERNPVSKTLCYFGNNRQRTGSRNLANLSAVL
jgi:hypothetical protein